jgi:hypothetical protein
MTFRGVKMHTGVAETVGTHGSNLLLQLLHARHPWRADVRRGAAGTHFRRVSATPVCGFAPAAPRPLKDE